MRYFEWDYDRGVVTEYERLGECKRCGECCHWEIHLQFVKPAYGDDPRKGAGNGTDGQGKWMDFTGEDGRRRLWKWSFAKPNIPCSGLTAEGLCLDHDNKAPVCALWPFGPQCLEHFPECGYSFHAVGEWPIEEGAQA